MANKEPKKERPQMSEQTPEPVQSAEIPEKKSKKKHGFLRRILLLLVILAAVMSVAVLSTMEDGHHFIALRRWLMYGETAQTQDLYTYASHQSNRWEQLEEHLLVVNPNSISLLQRGGVPLYELPVNMTAPTISVGTKLAAVCDAGGNTVYVLDSSGTVFTHTTDDDLLCYSARMNKLDQLAVTEQKSGYKAAVTVYDNTGSMLFRFDSHDKYLSDAAVTADGRSLVVVALDTLDGAFSSSLIVYDIATAERTGTYPLRDGLVLDFVINGEQVISLCDKRLAMTSLSGETLLNYTYGELYLHGYSITGGDFAALLLGRYQSSNICQLVTFGTDGTRLATLDLTEEVLDMDAAGEYLAVLCGDSLVIYDRTLTEVHRLEGTDYAGYVHMNEDGTALLAAESSAWRFLP